MKSGKRKDVKKKTEKAKKRKRKKKILQNLRLVNFSKDFYVYINYIGIFLLLRFLSFFLSFFFFVFSFYCFRIAYDKMFIINCEEQNIR